MRRLLLLALLIGCTKPALRKLPLPTGRSIALPAPGLIARTNRYPATIAISPDQRYAALLNQGYGIQETKARQSIAILDLANNQLTDFPDDRLIGDEKNTKQSYFLGLVFSQDGKHLYASMASLDQGGIAVYSFVNGQVAPERFIPIPSRTLPAGKQLVYAAPKGTVPAYPAGFTLLAKDRLLIADNLSDDVVMLDVASGEILKSFDVSAGNYVPTTYPYSVVANKAGTRAWVSLWNASAIAELDLEKGTVIRHISLWKPSDPVAPGTHPTAMLLNRSEDSLYVALSNAGTASADGVAEVDLKQGAPVRCYRAAIDSGDAPGSAPVAILTDADERHLYVASGSLNAVAVFEIKRDRPSSNVIAMEAPIGFIPSEWYPSALAVAGSDLLIANAKGESSGPNNMPGKWVTGRHPNDKRPYIAMLIAGSLQRMSFAQIEAKLGEYTQQVQANNFHDVTPEKIDSRIHHVIYVLRENRTYDQILGDLPSGNGDPSLTMYGADITPNGHKLALQFGVLDNFYDSGDVSANGHLWSDASATSDAIEKIWPILYRGSDRPEDFGIQLEQGVPDLDDPGTGFLWDNVAKSGLTYRLYGEMTSTTWCRDEQIASPQEGYPSPLSSQCDVKEIHQGELLNGKPSLYPWPIPKLKDVKPTKEAQRGHLDPLYPDFTIDYPDQLRMDEFLREFDQYVQHRNLPQFEFVFLPNDHTGGTRPGKPTPKASVADNDLALGRMVQAVSHSPYWDDTAIFVLEDDAQDGADHVDAHRSVALVISKYSPPSLVDHHFYTTVSAVHTIEALLGLSPMNLFDEHAPLMSTLFSGAGTQPPFDADDSNLRNGLLFKMNSPTAPGAQKSSQMDFTKPDANDAQELNAILWQDAMEVH